MRKLLASSLFRDTAKLVLGTAGGRAILLLALPLISRLFGPDDFKLLAVFIALISTVSVAACLRLEIAIPLAETDDDAANLLAMSLLSAATISAVLLALSGVAPVAFATALGTSEIAPYLWLVAIGIFLTASYTALQFWATRLRRFGIIARTRVVQAVTGVVTMLGLGWLGLAPIGLLLGNMLTLGAGGVSLALQALRHDRGRLRAITPAAMLRTLTKYRRYPVFSTPEALANVAGMQVPVLMIAAFSGAEAGQLFLAMQVMAAPLALIGASVGQVYASRASEELRNGTLHRFTLTMMKRLFLIGVVPITAAALLSPFLFTLVFGAEWQRAGVIVAWIAPWMLAQLVVSPVSMALHVVGAQRTGMLLQFLGFSIRAGFVIVATVAAPTLVVEVFAVSGVTFYVIYSVVVSRAVRIK
jgi:O-antigen/teichoic acid export membrane protein